MTKDGGKGGTAFYRFLLDGCIRFTLRLNQDYIVLTRCRDMKKVTTWLSIA
jgi:hypothetical protein